jgi:hypothetical protein
MNRPYCDDRLAARQQHDGPAGAVGFREDRQISEITWHVLIPPFMCFACLCSTSNSVAQKEGHHFLNLALKVLFHWTDHPFQTAYGEVLFSTANNFFAWDALALCQASFSSVSCRR